MKAISLALTLLLGSSPLQAAQGKDLVIQHFGERGATNRTLFASRPEGQLRVITGGALGAGSLQQEAFLAELLQTCGADAIAVGYEDLSAQGPDRRALLSSAKIPFVCANVKGAGRTHLVRTVGGTRVAFVGATKVPSYVEGFGLAKGWTIDDPAASLKALLPEVSKEADLVVLLAAMDRLECAELVKGVPGVHVALVPAAAGNDPEPLQTGTTTLVQSTTHPSAFSRLTLTLDARKGAAASNRVEAAELSDADRVRLQALFSKHKEGVDLDRLLAGVVLAPPPAPVRETGPLTSLEPGKAQPIVLVRSDSAVEIRIESVRVADAVGDRKAPPRSAWLVLQSEWKNLIPETSAAGRPLPTAYTVSDAANNLYLVGNGKILSRLEGELSGGPGGLLEGRSITLPRRGSVRRGSLVFPIPSTGVETLDLQFYDFRRQPSVFPLLARPGEAGAVKEKPILPVVKNEILEVGVFRITRGKSGGTAPEGMAYVVLDLRARSLATVEVESGPGGKARIGVAGDIQDAWKGLRLVSDGGRESEAEAGSLPGTPRFLPEAMTGWDVMFLVPEKAVNLELRWSFPDIGLPDGRVLKPAALGIPVVGKGAAARPLCPKCGETAGSSDKFCGRCGTKLNP